MLPTQSTSLISEKSMVYPYLEIADMESIGEINPIDLPLLSINTIKETIGKEVNEGNTAIIYQVNDCLPPRIYKVISPKKFKDGNEIRMSKIAGDIHIAPTFYSAFILEQNAQKFVVVEMDDLGKSLGELMEDLAEKSEVIEEVSLTEEEKAFQEMIKKMQERMGPLSIGIGVDVPEKKKLSLNETINIIYKNPEDFYCDLFTKIKILAENNIAYCDGHVGNIMPNYGTEKGLQLIDFGSAELMSDTKTAVQRVWKSSYNQVHFREFASLPNLSGKSEELFQWFVNQL